MKLIILALALPLSAATVTTTWADLINPPATTKYGVYRAPMACDAAPVFVKIATGLTAKTHADVDVPPGTYCYRVTAQSPTKESAPSIAVGAVIPDVPPGVPTGLTISISITVAAPKP